MVHDALRCFSLVQVMNGAIASAVTFLGYLYKNNSLIDVPHALPWSLLRFAFLALVGLVSHKALSTKRDRPWGVTRHTLMHAAIYLQLAWFSSELVLGSTVVALAPRILGDHITGEPIEETPFQFIPARAALQVYACGVLISIGAALCFGSRQRRHLRSSRETSSASQFIYQGSSTATGSKQVLGAALLQPLMQESSV